MKNYESTETFTVEHQRSRPYTRATKEAREAEKQKYLSIGMVQTKAIKSDDNAVSFLFWARANECVYNASSDTYHRKLDFLERWAYRELIDESRRFFPNGDMSRLVNLIGTEEGTREFARWEHHKDVLLDIAIERCEAKTGRRFVRATGGA